MAESSVNQYQSPSGDDTDGRHVNEGNPGIPGRGLSTPAPMIHSLYGNKEIFLRELISNASDAADRLRFEAMTDGALFENDPEPRIRVGYDVAARTITVSDNGIGMSRQDVVDNIGTIAKSGTREFLAQLTADRAQDAHFIGQFGVGFYASFIVADRVTLVTRRAGLHGRAWRQVGEFGRRRLHGGDRREGHPRHRRRPAPATRRGRIAVGLIVCGRSCASIPTTSPSRS